MFRYDDRISLTLLAICSTGLLLGAEGGSCSQESESETMSCGGPAAVCQTTSCSEDPHFCQTAADCAPVGCTCYCSGCGGFPYDDIVNIECVDTWYADQGCEPGMAGGCDQVCCAPASITCIDHTCAVTTTINCGSLIDCPDGWLCDYPDCPNAGGVGCDWAEDKPGTCVQPDHVCAATGGTWHVSECLFTCGQPHDCAPSGACDCGPTANFQGPDGCVEDPACMEHTCPPCVPPPDPSCIGSGPCGCGPYECPHLSCVDAIGSTDCAEIAAISSDIDVAGCELCQGVACGQLPPCDNQYPCIHGEISLVSCCEDSDCGGIAPFCGRYLGTNNVCVLSDDV